MGEKSLSNSIKQIISELASVVHAAIEDITEPALPLYQIKRLRTNALEKLSDEPEVSRKCPFCKKQLSEHYYLARHIASEHPKEAMKKYRESIKEYYQHPELVGERHQMITKIFTDQEEAIYGPMILCPFCEQPYLERELKKHVNQQHGEFMEIFYNVLKEG